MADKTEIERLVAEALAKALQGVTDCLTDGSEEKIEEHDTVKRTRKIFDDEYAKAEKAKSDDESKESMKDDEKDSKDKD